MAGTSLYDLIIPTFIKGLTTYDHVLAKAQEYAKEKGINVDEFLEARLVEDQLPLSFQVQNTSKVVQITVGRLTGVEPTLLENTEKTVAELRTRVQKTLELVKAVKPEDVNSREEALIDLPWAGKTHQVTVKHAVLNHGQTNFFFHLVTGYSILRAKGVPVGKADYLSNFLGL
ncbi:uncharacterized protein NECHADRAFT_52059 [Fusarium vanettenii 77-13-4]|uniref:Helix-turn-helix-domain containing protein type n=1 Tax=Fusarium vanettenii (strain ATCC MYA-4622 / CBS 123669 / FGSC 9596 / NRRL 45880 / 77-13-4) TaxID=660122 RepID=C7ZG78_FUSV7|nr:uncharacterized protein NECHADRAFT_52059 [Fusarium vanettenii 77-13-4]EEU37117.1 hypothetical protein NECHADRAFT_52059 [Fusarium vanettenii 77-13-4]